MANSNNVAQQIAQKYFAAMAGKDVERIMSITSDNVVCKSPIGQLEGAQAFRGFQEGFSRMIKKLTLLAAFGDDEHATIVYDASTHPVASAIVAELLSVKNGKITSTRVIYDATPFAEFMATARHQ